ncbi:MAG: hypothetical protein G01um101431_514 [Parcubacteria group bacterium Gr01-1014_31]|nr:MAG: hypothetical protein G01um101431_514 [Parcubacteria group bacterium Gr01-1014_31]
MSVNVQELRLAHVRNVVHDLEYEQVMLRRRITKASSAPDRLERRKLRLEKLPATIRRYRAELKRLEPPAPLCEPLPSLDTRGGYMFR